MNQPVQGVSPKVCPDVMRSPENQAFSGYLAERESATFFQ